MVWKRRASADVRIVNFIVMEGVRKRFELKRKKEEVM